MKKVLFLQNKGKSYAGVWNVNKIVGENLIKKGYEVHIVAIRNNQIDIELKHDPKLIVKTINEKDVWETYHIQDIKAALKKFKIFKAFKMLIERCKHDSSMKKDIKKLHEYIFDYDPDYIITTHYQLLDMIPESYLSRTINEHHNSFKFALDNPANIKAFEKYNGKVKYLWLTKSTMQEAVKRNYSNNYYIYNAVRISSDKIADVVRNKKLIVITRLAKDKRISLMVDIVKKVFEDKTFSDWTLEIFGEGEETPILKEKVESNKQIKLMGLTDDPKKELLAASINLNTSIYEGFSMSILEANECGLPTISFDFGENTVEQILDKKTGFIAKDIEDYENKLKELMSNDDLLKEMSVNAKEYSKEFQIENIIEKWIELFNSMDEEQK